MKKIILLTLAFGVFFTGNIAAQFPGCPAVSTATNVTIPCGQTCTNLTANAFAGAQTTAYNISAIPYSPPFAFNTGTQILVNTDDIWSGVISLPFNFCFFNNSYNQIVVGSNGVCSFKITNAGAFNSWNIPGPIPSATPADMTNCIMGPWQDIDPTNAGQVYYEIGGTYPCRYFKVSWYNVPYYGAANSVSTGSCPGQNLRATQQIILYETTNVIDMYIQQKQTCAAWNSGRAIQGIQNAAGTVAYTVAGRNAGAVWNVTNDAQRFTPAGAPNFTIAWFDGATQIGTGSTINVCPVAATTYTAEATYNSCGSVVVVSSAVSVGFSGVTSTIDSVHEISCAGGSDGAVYASYNTGSAILSYGWTPGGAGQTHLDGIPAGTYIFSVTDAANCTRSDTVVLVDPPQLVVDVPDVTITSCTANPTTTLTATPSGGTPGYSYSWTGGSTNPTITVGPGTYIATVTDSKNCTASDGGTVTITSSTPTFNQPVIIDATCAASNGSITVSVSGATNPVTYTWSNSLPNGDTQTGLAGGTYTVTATDANGCSVTASYTVGQGGAISFGTPTITDAICTSSTGSIVVNVIGAANPVNYTWSNGLPNSDTQTGLASGTYTVTAIDANGCSASGSYTVGQTGSISFGTPVIVDATCTASNGSITVNVTGATDPVTYTWSNSLPNSDTQSGLASGTYTVTAIDANGCSATASYTVGQTGSISFGTPLIEDESCAGNDGNLEVTLIGATPTVTYTWSNGLPDSDTQSGLAAGTYCVTATDGNGCSATACYTIAQAAPITFGTPTITNATCGGNDGSITVTVNGATNPIDYTWSNSLPNSATQTGLAAGTYTVTAVDASGCSATASYMVGQGASFTFGTPVMVDATCAGNDGSIVVTTNGATAPINYNWTGGLPNNDTVTGLAVGSYGVTATDANGCSATATYNVGQGNAIVITNAVVNDVSCSGNGSITITATGGTGTLTYTWTGGLTGNPLTNLPAGTYNLTITDQGGCSVTATYIVGTSPCGDCPAVSTNNNVTIPCGQACANLTATAIAGAQTTSYTGAPIAYNPAAAFNTGTPILVNIDDTWSGQIALPFNFCFFGNTFGNLYVGSNGVIGFNAPPFGNGNSWAINGPIPSATPNDLRNCIMGPWQDLDPTFQGDIYYSIIGTYPCRQFVVSWYQVPMFGDPNSVSTGSCNNPLSQTQQIVLYETTNVIDIYIQDKGSCLGWNNGLAIEGIQNNAGTVAYAVPGRNGTVWSATNDAYRFTPAGAPNYVINWFDGATQIGTGENITVCPANTTTYTVQAVYTNCDNSTVTVSDSVYVTVQGGLTATVDSVNNISCSGGNDGAVYASYTSTGGTVTSFGWSPGGAGQTSLTGIPAGTYIFNVTNLAGCSISDTAIVTEPSPLVVNVPDTTVYNCSAGVVFASLTATASGGTATYTYDWGNGNTNATITGVSAGTYTVTATDTNGCSATGSGTVNQVLASPVFNQEIIANVTCNGANDGSIIVSVSQATAPIDYSWSGGLPNNDTVTGLAPGTYNVTATDANGCSATASYIITEPAPIVIGQPTITDATCTVGGTITVTATGGTGTLVYDWSNSDSGSFIDSLAAGPYTLTVTDANGCSATASYVVDAAPNTVAFDAPVIVDVTCNGGNNGSITASATGGTGTITYTWNTVPQQTGATASGLSAGSYSVTIADAVGCSASTTYTVNESTLITIDNVVITPASCTTGGTVTVIASGGTGTLSITWSNGDTGNLADSLAGGSVTVTVTDANSCSITATYTVPAPNTISFGNSIVTDITCNGLTDGSIHVVVVGGTSPIVFTWNPQVSTDSIATGLSAGSYSVTVSDAGGCSASTTFTIDEPTPLVLGTATVVDATCSVGGSITVPASGGTGNPTYNWTGPSGSLSGNPITGLAGGTYTLTVTDANLCSVTASYTVAGAAGAITFGTPTLTQPTCNGGTNGSITVTTSGGTGTIGYVWGGSSNVTATLSPIGAGTYTVTASDPNGCSTTASYTLGQPTAITLGQPDITPVTCSALGSIGVFPNGGTGTLTLNWSNGDSGTFADSLSAGPVTVTVTDASGCSVTASYTITTGAGTIAFGTPIINNVSCNGANDGSISVNASGGTGTITFTWGTNPTQVGATITGLSPASYTVTASDQGGCTVSATYTVTEPAALSVTVNATALLCFGDTTGSATAVVTGGTGNITYHWNDNQNTATVNDLEVGIVLVTVTDANGCTAKDDAIIGQSPSLSYNSQVNQPNCSDLGFGTEILTPRGGTGAITISIPGLSVNTTLSMVGGDTLLTQPNVPTGNYTFTLTDALGCTATGNFFVNAGAANENFDVNADSTSCFGQQFNDGAVTVTPLTLANAPYTYSLNGGAFQSDSSFTGLAAGTYTIVTKNTYGCLDTVTAVIEQPAQLFVNATPDTIVTGAGVGNPLTVDIQNFVSNPVYTWSPVTGLSCDDCSNPTATVTANTVYYVVVAEEANKACVASDSVVIIVTGKFKMPNAFSPNGDDKNDSYGPVGNMSSYITITDFRIYNRWGQLVHNALENWNGKIDGKDQLAGTYIYYIGATMPDADNPGTDKVVIDQGAFTLLRQDFRTSCI